MWRKLRIAILLLALAIAAYGNWYDRLSTTDWDETLWIGIFPINADGTPLTYSLDKLPYIEVSAGVGNILKIFRVELIRRLTYLDHPVVSEYGVRARFKIDF